MRIKNLLQWIMRVLLILVVASSVLSLPNQSVAAKPLAAAFTDCAAQTEIPTAECDALVALYNSTDGANWTNHTDWRLTDLPCSWYGVTCDGGTNVTNLSLGSNNLSGTIPPGLGNLTLLIGLNLSGNHLSGSIPSQLGNLANLTLLDLRSNQLSGPIPLELGNLASLRWLLLGGNQLTGFIPPELGNLASLTSLNLDGNQLTGSIPSELGNQINLWSLDLSGNQLNGFIPAELGNLTQLEWLLLSSNQLTGSIPTELGNLTQLHTLVLSGNQLTGSIPVELGNLTNLTGLSLGDWGGGGNQLTGSIPMEFGNLTNLTQLWMFNNQLTGSIPTELGNLTNLMSLELGNNKLSGSIPSTLGNLTKLQYLDLSNNQLDSSIPMELGNLTNLSQLELSSNQLTGSLPTQLGNLTNLTRLDLCGNQLSGSIPTELGDLSQLQYLELGWNQLTGTIPAKLENLTNLWHLGLYTNQLTGSIPAELGNLTNLRSLQLGNNQLTGSIPTELGNLINLTGLDLSLNQLAGSIPAELGNLINLTGLDLSRNQLTGEFPISITNLVNLQYFLFDCQLTSSDPAVIAFINNIVPNWQDNICSAITPVVTVSALNPMIGMEPGQSQWIRYIFTETAGGTGTINSLTYGFYTQAGVPISSQVTTGIYTKIQPNQTVNYWRYVNLPQQVVNEARKQGQIAIKFKTSFAGISAIGNSFSAETSVLIVLPPDKFSKSSPANGAINQPTNVTLNWASSAGAIDYEYCIDTINNNRCDTEWYGTYDLNKSLTDLLPNTTYYWHVRAHNYVGGATSSNNGDWWSFKTISNSPPTNITLSNSKVAENKAIGTLIGTLTTTDPDAGDTFTYSLTCAAPGVNDGSFSIFDKNLKTKAMFNYEVKKNYSICVRTTDSGGLFFDKKFTISVTDVLEQTAKNGGFNTYSIGKKVPTSWGAINFAMADGKDTIVKKEGLASLKIIGARSKVKTLTQTLALSGSLGDTFTFSYYVKATKFPITGLCQAQVTFYNGATLKGTKILKCPVGTTYGWKQAKLNFTAPAAYTKVVIKFTYSKASGAVWFDAVSLMR